MTRTTPLVFAALLSVAPLDVIAAQRPAAAGPERTGGGQQLTNGQRPTINPWLPFLGCWNPGARPGQPSETTLCVVPDGAGVRMVTFTGEREVLSETIVADGTTQAMQEQGCSGERVTRWASSGTRLFSASTLACAGQPAVKTTGLSALLSTDQWLDVQVANAGGREQVRTRRFWRSPAPAPASVAEALRGTVSTRPLIASATVDDVIEASRNVAAVGVEAWLAESRAQVPLDRRALVRLSDGQVAPQVIDLMVALAYPQKFEVRRNSGGGGSWSSGWLDDFYPGEWGYLADVYGYGFGSFGMPYFIGANGYFNYPGGFQFVPVGGGGGSSDDASHGQVVNGQGYTRVQPREAVRSAPLYQGGNSQASSGAGDGSGGSTDSGAGSSGSGVSAASPGGYSGGGGTSTGLTAVPR